MSVNVLMVSLLFAIMAVNYLQAETGYEAGQSFADDTFDVDGSLIKQGEVGEAVAFDTDRYIDIDQILDKSIVEKLHLDLISRFGSS